MSPAQDPAQLMTSVVSHLSLMTIKYELVETIVEMFFDEQDDDQVDESKYRLIPVVCRLILSIPSKTSADHVYLQNLLMIST